MTQKKSTTNCPRFSFPVLIMQQPKLQGLAEQGVWKSVSLHHIKAFFVEVAERMHDVVLEINSQKFLVRVKVGLKKLEHFEILAIK